jgi:hypothetical protein
MSKKIYVVKRNFIPKGAALDVVNREKSKRLRLEEKTGLTLSDEEYNFYKIRIKNNLK